MISVLATIEVAEDRCDDFLGVFKELVPKVLAEQGCVEYGPWIDVPNNITEESARENVIVVIEKWESLDALEAHLMAPHMLEFRKAIEGMRVGISLHILGPA